MGECSRAFSKSFVELLGVACRDGDAPSLSESSSSVRSFVCFAFKMLLSTIKYSVISFQPVAPAIACDMSQLLVCDKVGRPPPCTHNYVAVSLSLSIDFFHIHSNNLVLCSYICIWVNLCVPFCVCC